MLRIYFKYDRSLLTGLCQCAYRSLLRFLREVVGLKNGVPGVVIAIHTFGEYPHKFHPHLHAIVTDGLFRDTGTFYVMRQTDLKPLEVLFRAEVFKFLKKEGKITDELIRKLMAWRHSGFSIDNGVRIKRIDVSKYQPKKVPSLTWCECIKKIWKDDPLICPECQSEMRILSFLSEGPIIHKILKHLGLWDEETARDPPPKTESPEIVWTPVSEVGWEYPDQPDIVG
jgi:hypothetical protein